MAKVNGKSGLMTKSATCMKVSMKMIRRMEWVCSLGKAEIIIKDAIKMMRDMDTVKCAGRMVHATKVNGKWVFKMALARWNFLMAVLKKVSLKITLLRVHK